MTKERDIIGLEYKTNKTTIKVIRKTDIKKSGKYLYEIECNVCSKDKELFPTPILFPKRIIDMRQVSCGCGKNPVWLESQFEVLVRRKCTDCGFTFLGFVGEFNGNKTKVKILDSKNNQIWESQTINKILGDRGPKNPNLFCKTDKDLIDEIKTSGNFLDGTQFFKEGGTWFYSCPICREDEFAQAGLCAGSFRSTRSNLRKGNKSCRCSVVYKPNQEQVNFKVNKILKGKGILLSTGGWYKGNRSKLKYFCLSCETEASINYHDLCRGSFCRNCCKTGYSADKPGRIYLIRWFDENELEFLKFGITNLESKTRINRQKSKSGLNYEVILDLYFKDGGIPLMIENEIKEKFESGFISKTVFPDGFTETLPLHFKEAVVSFINDRIPYMEV